MQGAGSLSVFPSSHPKERKLRSRWPKHTKSLKIVPSCGLEIPPLAIDPKGIMAPQNNEL